MKKAFAFLFFFCLFAWPAISSTAPGPQIIIPLEKKHTKENQPKNISSLKVKDLEKAAGRKLTAKEKVAFFILKKKLKKAEETTSKEGQTAFSFGIIAVALLIAGLFVPYVILGSLIAAIVAVVMGSSALKRDRNDRKAHLGKLLGWITLGLIALLLIAVAVAISGWNW